jgi:hypothetical protein
MTSVLEQFWRELIDRPSGPLALRFVAQPLIALLLSLRDGAKDAHAGRPAYFWALFTHPERRREMLQSGWESVGKVFSIAFALDLVYQWLVFEAFRPIEGLTVAFALAIVPYVLFRGPANRFIRRLALGEREA